MAKARICDRCGEIITDAFYDYTIHKIRISDLCNLVHEMTDFEICKKCTADLVKFLKD